MYHKPKIYIETTVGYFIYLFGLHWGPYWSHDETMKFFRMRATQAQGKWAARTSGWDAHTLDTRKIGLRAPQACVHTPGTETVDCMHFRMGCAHLRYEED